ncbi:MAG: polyprenyl synthetase family protein [Bacteroidota bacterium]|nr:polyprenyl synthetase family protein [Bacteroidota bacterium]
MSSIEKIKAPIAEEMNNFQKLFKAAMHNQSPLLSIITNYLYQRKGKQMRPIMVFLSAKMHGEINQSTYTAASLIELLHTATLVHDDIVDDSNYRRGFFSVYALWKSKISVLVGDYLLAQGLLLAVNNKEMEILEIVSHAVKEMSEGELLQLEHARKFMLTESQYLDIIEKKTAALLAACAASGTSSVHADNQIIEAMKQFGTNVGIAFQMKDDLLDYQNTGLLGKPTGNDIKEQKMTLPLIYALENASYSTKKSMIQIIKKVKRDSSKLPQVIDFVIASGGIDYTSKKMNEYKNKALDLLNTFPDNESKLSLIQFVNFTTEREK